MFWFFFLSRQWQHWYSCHLYAGIRGRKHAGGTAINISQVFFIMVPERNWSLFCSEICQRVDLSLKNSMPWLVLAGSGGLADFLSDVLQHLSSIPVVQSSGEGHSEAPVPGVDLKERVAEWVKRHFPSETELDKLVERVSAVGRDISQRLLQLQHFSDGTCF